MTEDLVDDDGWGDFDLAWLLDDEEEDQDESDRTS